MTVTHVLELVRPPPLLPEPAVPAAPDPVEHGIGITVPLTNGPQPPPVALAAAGVGLAAAGSTRPARISTHRANPTGIQAASRRAGILARSCMARPQQLGTARASDRPQARAE